MCFPQAVQPELTKGQSASSFRLGTQGNTRPLLLTAGNQQGPGGRVQTQAHPGGRRAWLPEGMGSAWDAPGWSRSGYTPGRAAGVTLAEGPGAAARHHPTASHPGLPNGKFTGASEPGYGARGSAFPSRAGDVSPSPESPLRWGARTHLGSCPGSLPVPALIRRLARRRRWWRGSSDPLPHPVLGGSRSSGRGDPEGSAWPGSPGTRGLGRGLSRGGADSGWSPLLRRRLRLARGLGAGLGGCRTGDPVPRPASHTPGASPGPSSPPPSRAGPAGCVPRPRSARPRGAGISPCKGSSEMPAGKQEF